MPKFYAVIGRGEFPIDMLRRDQSTYVNDAEKAVADDNYNPYERTVLLTIPDGFRSRPNEERWQSFGWRVVQNDMRLPSLPPQRPRVMPGGEDYHALMQQIRTLRAALRPFAEFSKQFDRGHQGHPATDRLTPGQPLTVGDLHRAADALIAKF